MGWAWLAEREGKVREAGQAGVQATREKKKEGEEGSWAGLGRERWNARKEKKKKERVGLDQRDRENRIKEKGFWDGFWYFCLQI